MPKKDVTSEERLNLAISLVSLLLAEGEVGFSDAANHFDVSEKTLRDLIRTMNEAEDLSRFISFFYIDLDLLESEGVLRLVEAEALNELPRLSRQQILALATGLDYLATLPNFSSDSELSELRQILSGSRAPTLEVPSAIEQRLELIQGALTSKRVISCRYVNQTGESRLRKIQPLRIDFVSAKYYLRGVCEDSRMLKSFRVDRISEIEVLNAQIDFEALSIDIPDAIYGDAPGELEVTVRVAPEAREFLSGYPLASRTASAGGGGLEAKIITGNFATLGRQVVKFGGKVEVLSPPEARESVRTFASRMIAELSGASEAATE